MSSGFVEASKTNVDFGRAEEVKSASIRSPGFIAASLWPTNVRDATSDLAIDLPAAALRPHILVVLVTDEIFGAQQLKYWTPGPSIQLKVFTILWNKNKGHMYVILG